MSAFGGKADIGWRVHLCAVGLADALCRTNIVGAVEPEENEQDAGPTPLSYTPLRGFLPTNPLRETLAELRREFLCCGAFSRQIS
jgi:hypothetical protein